MEDDKRKKWKWNIKNIKKDQLLILFLIGILLLVISLPAENKKDADVQSQTGFLADERETEDETKAALTDDADTYLYRLEKRLESALHQMAGVGNVSVMITLESSAERVVEKDLEITDEAVTESDSQGGTRTTKDNNRKETAIYSGGNANGSPYISKELTPEVEGVIVIAEGGDDPQIKQDITEAVQALFGIDTHKIRIMKKSSK